MNRTAFLGAWEGLEGYYPPRPRTLHLVAEHVTEGGEPRTIVWAAHPSGYYRAEDWRDHLPADVVAQRLARNAPRGGRWLWRPSLPPVRSLAVKDPEPIGAGCALLTWPSGHPPTTPHLRAALRAYAPTARLPGDWRLPR